MIKSKKIPNTPHLIKRHNKASPSLKMSRQTLCDRMTTSLGKALSGRTKKRNNIELLEKRWVSRNKIKWNSIELLEKKIERKIFRMVF
jgi:hypothetical protein